jgi:hypothetical protein
VRAIHPDRRCLIEPAYVRGLQSACVSRAACPGISVTTRLGWGAHHTGGAIVSGDLTSTLADLVRGRGMRALLLYGPRGSGKSTFVTRVRDQWRRQGGVVAYRDLSLVGLEDDWDPVEVESVVQQVIARLAWDLRVDCRRLVASRVAMDLTLPSTDLMAARQKMLEEWLQYSHISDRWRKLGDMAGGVVGGTHASRPWGGMVQPAIGEAVSWALHSVARKALPPTLRWFADPCVLQTRGKDANTALDVLCDLSVNAAGMGDVRARREATRIQLLALLADLASAWSSGAARHRADTVVFLLDNVDTAVGRRLAAVWNEAWTALRARRQTGAVPLSLVATAENPTSLMSRDALGHPVDAATVHLPDHGPDLGLWQAVRMPALTRDEVQQRARQRLGSEIDGLVGALVHEAAAGHRGATETLLEPGLRVPHDLRTAVVLIPHIDSADVEDRLLGNLLDPAFGPEVTSLLCCCAVAHRRTAAEALLPVLVRGGDPVSGQVRQLLDTLPMWTESEDRPTLLRRLLLRRLARADNRSETWARLHRRLIDSNVNRAYYLMGLENARAAADVLVDELTGGDSGQSRLSGWVRRIHSVAVAPRAAPLPGASAAEQASALRKRAIVCDGAEPGGPQEEMSADPSRDRSRAVLEVTCDLLILLAVASDPFRAVPRGQLHRQVSTCYGELERVLWEAGHHDDDGALPHEIQTHMAQANYWRQLERTVPRSR